MYKQKEEVVWECGEELQMRSMMMMMMLVRDHIYEVIHHSFSLQTSNHNNNVVTGRLTMSLYNCM